MHFDRSGFNWILQFFLLKRKNTFLAIKKMNKRENKELK